MLFTCKEDFFEKTGKMVRLSREEEKRDAELMYSGDLSARERIVESYLVVTASLVRRLSEDMQTLDLIYRCVDAVEKAIDKFNFLQENEPFIHRLSILFRQITVKSIADK